MKLQNRLYVSTALGAGCLLLLASQAFAQTEPGAPSAAAARTSGGAEDIGDIVVTARKRSETLISVPVAVTAVTKQEIENRKINSIYDASAITPGLIIGHSFINNGVTVFLRGVGNTSSNIYSAPSVLLNVDGASTNSGTFFQGALFDVSGIEVLKGPQALYFGRSATAGIIALHTGDPTSRPDAELTGGYEANAREFDIRGFVSTPITPELGIRLAGFYTNSAGYLRDPDPLSLRRRVGGEKSYGGRVTLAFDKPELGLRAKLKLSATDRQRDVWNPEQRRCTFDTPQNPVVVDNCKVDNVISGIGRTFPAYNPNLNYAAGNAASFAQGTPLSVFADGKPFGETKTKQAIFDASYDITPGLTLNSLTSYSRVSGTERGQLDTSKNYLGGLFWDKEFSQEARLTSDFKDSWINFMVGGAYSTTRNYSEIGLVVAPSTIWFDTIAKNSVNAKTAFGQVMFTPLKHWELSAGVRYTEIHEFFTSLIARNNILPDVLQGEGVGKLPQNAIDHKEHNYSPEVTLTYRPSQDLTAYASYKRGYKGPTFNINTIAATYAVNTSSSLPASLVPGINPVKGERVSGGELGLKGVFFDRQLVFTSAVYLFDYKGLQSSFNSKSSAGQAPVTQITNAADARNKGIEGSIAYSPRAVPGLSLHAAANYTHLNYTRFVGAPCYNGQTTATGCVGGAQDLTGRHAANAPRWTGEIGANYDMDVFSDYRLGLSANMNFSSAYNVVLTENPNGHQPGWTTVDASIRLSPRSDHWSLALIGRNLTNRYYATSGQDSTPLITAGVPTDSLIFVNRGRQVQIQLTVRPF